MTIKEGSGVVVANRPLGSEIVGQVYVMDGFPVRRAPKKQPSPLRRDNICIQISISGRSDADLIMRPQYLGDSR
jgi:hypothetical protein